MPDQDINPLRVLIGRDLSSIEFIRNYVQLRFDGPTLTAISLPTVRTPTNSFEWGQAGYRDVLCGCIGKLVDHAESIADQEIKIEFQDGVSISINLEPEKQCHAECAILDDPPNPIVVWP